MRSQACVTYHRHANLQGSPLSYMTPATTNHHFPLHQSQRESPPLLHIVVQEASKGSNECPAEGSVRLSLSANQKTVFFSHNKSAGAKISPAEQAPDRHPQ
jgi:hypothetical protein